MPSSSRGMGTNSGSYIPNAKSLKILYQQYYPDNEIVKVNFQGKPNGISYVFNDPDVQKIYEAHFELDEVDGIHRIRPLLNENKEIYIGSANKLGDRVKEGRKEIPNWTKFKYDIIHPKYHHLIRRIEFHTIRAFSGFFQNKGNMKYFPVSTYKLVNKKWPKRLS